MQEQLGDRDRYMYRGETIEHKVQKVSTVIKDSTKTYRMTPITNGVQIRFEFDLF